MFEEIIAKNFPNLGKETDIQGAQIHPNKMRPTQRHILTKLAKYNDKEKI